MENHNFINRVYPANLDDLAREQGSIPPPLKRGEEVNIHLIAILVREVRLREEALLAVPTTDVDLSAMLMSFYAKMCDTDHLVKDRVFVNMLSGALSNPNFSIKQCWVAINYGLSGVICTFQDIASQDYAKRFSKNRKCPLLQYDGEEDTTKFYAPAGITGDCALYQSIITWFDYDEIVTVENKYFEMSSNTVWYTIADEFNKIMRSDSISYSEGGRVSIHNILVSAALRKCPMARKPLFNSPLKSLEAQFREELTKDSRSLLECIIYTLAKKEFKVGKKSLIDANYLIQRSLPVVMYEAKDRETNQKVLKRRSYAPFGWHKIAAEHRNRNNVVTTLPEYGQITVAARNCAVDWTNILPKLMEYEITEETISHFKSMLGSIITISQNIKKSWIVKSETTKVVNSLNIMHRAIPKLLEVMSDDMNALQTAEKGDYSLLSVWLQQHGY